ncbi:type III pantothenate kinase [Sulfuricurvum sp. IAE1]|uniref:type III pantothenate kinase n=1 Tax=Sulfuricurvum sp. IAE1 TaxID=2546102 RepID=UPI001043E7C3|nr:type III pantothenate kinase [Sulfuricurvum sp. IAE1]TDA64125.1 type III pantothenate kinase [Sulfuricurvum sp. IAE1]
MILCDVGNTSVDLYRNGKRTKHSADTFDPFSISEEVYFISVNAAFDRRVAGLVNWHDLRECVVWTKYYPTMGIDRIAACEAIEEGVVVDAGSAITVDVMRGGAYQGGFIALGLRAAQEAYGRLSPALDVSWNFEVDLAKMAKNTPDAVTAGFLAPLIAQIQSLGKPVHLCGGDAKMLSRFFPDAVVDEELVFKGMKKLIEKGRVC